MLKLILDHDYVVTPPAVDASGFGHHGRLVSTSHVPDGAAAGSGAIDCAASDSAVRIAPRPAWRRFRALAIEALVLVRPSSGRRNLVEGDGSFALFIDGDDMLVGSFLATVDGGAGPAWTTLSSSTHSPDGVPRTVPVDTWCRVVLHHDGLTRARLFVDGTLVATRSDYRSALAGVGNAGVVVGNWTLSSQFAFDGLVDRVRVWKDDENAAVAAFGSRDLDPATRDVWDDLWRCLAETLGPEARERMRDIEDTWTDFVRAMVRAMQAAGGDERVEAALATYRRNWRANTLDDPSHVEALETLHTFLGDHLGGGWLDDLRGFAGGVRDRLGPAVDCFDGDRLQGADPVFARFVEQALGRFS